MDIQQKLLNMLTKDLYYNATSISEITGIERQRVYRLINNQSKLNAQEFYEICVKFEINLSYFDEL